MLQRFEHAFFRFLFFGNVFYGFCVLSLAVEASLQQHKPLNSLNFYCFLFFGTLAYYNIAYSSIEQHSNETNPRILWRLKHHKILKRFQLFNILLCLLFAISVFSALASKLYSLQRNEIILLVVFP